MFFQRIFTPGLSIHSYLIGDERTKRCAAIDPIRNVVPYIMMAQGAGYEITHILETHVHADFVSGAKELKHQLNEKPKIYCSGRGGKEWIPSYADEIVGMDTEVRLGELLLKPVHTPGHTPEHLIWVCYDETRSKDVPWFAFTGDSVFVGSVGRPDLLGKEEFAHLAPQLYHTLFDVLAPFPDFLEIYPSHGQGSLCGKGLKSRGSSTLGYERRFNHYFKKIPEEEWVKIIELGQPPAPPYFTRMKKINREGPPLLNTLKCSEWGEKGDAPSLSSLFLLDIRLSESFAESHLKDSINIQLNHSFMQWAGWMLPEEGPLGLVVENVHHGAEAVEQLRLIGFDQDIWIIPFGDEHPSHLYPTTSFCMMEPEELGKEQPDFSTFQLIDVRTTEEWKAGHIPGALHLELTSIEKQHVDLPSDKMLVFLCKSGNRSSLAASLFEKKGFSSIGNVRGGMMACEEVGLPLVKET